ncbi:HNH endonuclease [Nocardia uniformis]|uniref:HNH endonuclease n=1 Tax=Nocardia uniformis TaxID=53432 RepID=A0A849BVQ1_9NOCA|nr:HNH endonuclease [Nocardia uniformis]
MDHIKPLIEAPELAFKRSNLQVLCRVCNSRKSAGERRTGATRGVGPGGDQEHPSGKAEFALHYTCSGMAIDPNGSVGAR